MFFQIDVTPRAKQPKVKVKINVQEEQTLQVQRFTLVLAPFQPQPRINLDSNLYNTVQCILNIKNIGSRKLNVTVTKIPPKERAIKLSALELSVEAESEAELGIAWTPQEAGSWRDTLQLTDSRRIKYDVALITTARDPSKRRGKAGTRVLGLANSNASSIPRGKSPSQVRQLKKTLGNASLSQLNVPNKRPRLTTQSSNKENVKNSWIHETKTRKHLKACSHSEAHNFSSIINSSNFNFTSVNLNNIKDRTQPEIQIKEERTSCSNNDVHNFSSIIDSSTFNFTSANLDITTDHTKQIPIIEERNLITLTPEFVEIFSPSKNDETSNLRRNTYITESKFHKHKIVIKEEKTNVEVEEFEDSLSPQPMQSSGSLIVNSNIHTPNSQCLEIGASNFSPNSCSTGNRMKPNASINSRSSSLNLAGNNTFNVSGVHRESILRGNSTYELLPTSPTRSTEADSLKPVRLSRNFCTMSPVSSEIPNEWKKKLAASSPIAMDSIPMHCDFSRRTSITHKKNNDDASVKDVLEANLWVQSDTNYLKTTTTTTTTLSFIGRCNSLEKIEEERYSNGARCSTGVNKTTTQIKTDKLKEKCRCMQISPPNKYLSRSKISPIRRVSPTKSMKIRKERSVLESSASLRKKVQLNCSIQRGNVTIPGVRITNLSLAGLNKNSSVKNKSLKSETSKTSVKLSDPNDIFMMYRNPDMFAATMTQDPFLSNTVYYDDNWIKHQEMEFKKWLNALLSPPEHLDADVDTIRVDVGKVWQSCRAKENVTLAESREAVSARYHTNTRLDTLRKAAGMMFRRQEVTSALSKAAMCVERKILMIRQDRNLHRNIGLQKRILELFLSYNPLWLRIGLEIIYGETIPLQSNNDLVGLTRFLISRFFSDPFIIKTHSHTITSNIKLSAFVSDMNKFILKKFLLLVYFLDYAKRNKLIGHDPCLFHKRAEYKDSRSILLAFSRELLSGVGDVTKVLRAHDYVVSHKQTYLDEYDYAVNDISTDLRDGVRLCRVMELITGDRNLTCRCRVPAISRLQKVHNADIALKALLQCGYNLTGDIDARSVVDGNREKTLSLLWQIIYKYQAPKFEKSAKYIQKWWRSFLWYIRVRNFLRDRKKNAASTIQRAWKCHKSRRILQELRDERNRRWAEKEEAVRVIQRHWIRRMRMSRERQAFLIIRISVVKIQRWFRVKKATGPAVCELRRKRRAVVMIQRYWRARCLMIKKRNMYLDLVKATLKLQTLWRARRAVRYDYKRYQKLKNSVVLIQSKWRAQRAMKIARKTFLLKLNAAKKIHNWWHSISMLKRDRNNYLLKKHAVRSIEIWWISQRLMESEKKTFDTKRKSAMIIQRAWRKHLQSKNAMRLKNIARASRTIQVWWRSVRIAKQYKIMKNSCLIIQRWWRVTVLMKSERTVFLNLRKAAIIIQKSWRMKRARRDYLRTKNAVSLIESWYNNCQMTRAIRQEYQRKKNSSLVIQNWWRNWIVTREHCNRYLELRRSVIFIQRQWRANSIAMKTRMNYLKLKEVATKIGARWRMIKERKIYLNKLKAAVILQKRWRETLNARTTRKNYVEYRSACVFIQNRYRELRISRATRNDYLLKRRAAIIIQKNWKMFTALRKYKKLKSAATTLQSAWRSRKLCICTRIRYLALINATIIVQRHYRAKKIGFQVRQKYLQLRSITLFVQRQWRANKSMKEARARYLDYRNAAVILQAQWRMILQIRQYRLIRKSILTIQTKWRAWVAAKKARTAYLCLRHHVLLLQRRYRNNKCCKAVRQKYIKTRNTIIAVQRLWRIKLENRRREEAAIALQTWCRSIISMRECRQSYENQRSAVVVIQRRYRAYKIGTKTRQSYLHIVCSVVKIQRRWRQLVQRRRYEEWLRDCKKAVLILENWWRNILEKRRISAAAVKIQTIWRGYSVRIHESPTMKALRVRSEKAAKAAVQSATVARQLKSAMEVLLVADTIGHLTVCVTVIDTLTRLSLEGSIRFCALNFVDKIYWTLAKANRSIPWLDVCLRSTSILITLAKYPNTRNYVYKVEHIETIARLMKFTVEQHVDLFRHLATLLWLLAENPEFAKAITSCPRTTWLLKSLYALINKKNKVPAAMASKPRGKETMAPLPNTKPDWGLQQKRPRLFTTVHHAITSLMKRLKMDLSK